MMGVAHVSVYVREDAPLVTRLHGSVAGGPRAWLYLDEGLQVALWGSPAAMRRLAAALVVAAEEADALLAPRPMAGTLDGSAWTRTRVTGWWGGWWRGRDGDR